MTPLLDVKDIRKSFGALQAIGGVSFTLNRGEILGIAGPNGSGKSTLFNILTKIPFPPDSGEVSLDGKPLKSLGPRQIVDAGLLRIFQTEMDFESLTVLENILVSMPDKPGSGTPSSKQKKADELLELFGLTAHSDRLAGEINVYDRKRLMVATAFAHNPLVLLLDEPAAGLSKPEIEEMVELIRQLNRLGVSIILIEHIIPLLVAVSDRLIVLNFGEVLAEGLPREIVRNPKVVEAYIGNQSDG
ncbi:ABC transporter ATP-binding protein [Hoeflea sp. WL0058]|uniref:ABC transporter ATP-binding protein n=1 Tax=Flavimaribacter sediminis TaxID=2865987 RepID=A0AAE2ZN82_9HYPH|nr:ABC transporter ATP-binding protein [Flavimaribacter sediminis]MBW8639044.1 ABC transporter ATP-binding protein [Flavimaribacter sediminis]